MVIIFSIVYIVFFIYLNLTIFRSLELGFKTNKKQILISTIITVFLLLFQGIFKLEGMIKDYTFFLLVVFSLSLIISHFMFKFMHSNMDNRLNGSNPILRDSFVYGVSRLIFGLIINYASPVMVTVFQIIVIINPKIQADLSRH